MSTLSMKVFPYYRAAAAWLFAMPLVTSCFAASNTLEFVVRSFPEVDASRYRPDLAARAANAFIAAGEQVSLEILNGMANKPPDLSGPNTVGQKLNEREALNRRIIFVSRLIYVPKRVGDPLRPPRLGGFQDLPYESMARTREQLLLWPYLPFVITNGIPLSMNLGYAGSGIPERAEDYLAYCRSNGTFRAEFFAQPTLQSASNALNQVFESAAWKGLRWKDRGIGWSYDLNEGYARKQLWKQVEKMPGGARAPKSQSSK